MFHKRTIGLAAVGLAAAGALALSAAGVAGAVVTPVSVTVTPNNFSVMAGTAITPESVVVTLDAVLQNAKTAGHVTESVTASGLPAGVALNSAGTIISGTPTTAGSGTAVVTATAVETETSLRYLVDLTNPDLPFDATNCTYALTGPSSFLVSKGTGEDADLTISITGLTLAPKTGVFSYNVVVADPDDPTDAADNATYPGSFGQGEVLSGPSFDSAVFESQESNYTVTKTCTGSADVSWAVQAVPTTTTTTTPPTTTTSSGNGVPGGSVQTGGGLPVSHNSDWWIALIPLAGGLAIGGPRLVVARRRARAQV